MGHVRTVRRRSRLSSEEPGDQPNGSALTATYAEPVEVLLAQATAEVAKRFHLGLQLDLVPGVKVSAAREDALVRFACEAAANAARHSGANWVHLKLERDGPRLRLRVSDQGRGLDPAVTHGGFGLVSCASGPGRSVGSCGSPQSPVRVAKWRPLFDGRAQAACGY